MVGRVLGSRRTAGAVGVAAGGAALVVVLSHVTGGADARDAPDLLRVACSASGIDVDAAVVAARPDGVRLALSSSLPRGSYLTYAAAQDGPRGGTPLGAGERTFAFPPGTLQLSCAGAPGMDDTGATTLRVVDPHGYWRTRTIEDAGCHPSAGQPSWAAGSGSGPTARAAAEASARSLDQATGAVAPSAVEPLEVGYVGSRTQTWLITRDGHASLTLAVTRRGAAYASDPDVLCD